jgi:hypothetical protein
MGATYSTQGESKNWNGQKTWREETIWLTKAYTGEIWCEDVERINWLRNGLKSGIFQFL